MSSILLIKSVFRPRRSQATGRVSKGMVPIWIALLKGKVQNLVSFNSVASIKSAEGKRVANFRRQIPSANNNSACLIFTPKGTICKIFAATTLKECLSFASWLVSIQRDTIDSSQGPELSQQDFVTKGSALYSGFQFQYTLST